MATDGDSSRLAALAAAVKDVDGVYVGDVEVVLHGDGGPRYWTCAVDVDAQGGEITVRAPHLLGLLGAAADALAALGLGTGRPAALAPLDHDVEQTANRLLDDCLDDAHAKVVLNFQGGVVAPAEPWLAVFFCAGRRAEGAGASPLEALRSAGPR